VKYLPTSNRETFIKVKLEQHTVWLSQNQLAQLFEQDKSVISQRLKNMYKEGELDKTAIVAKKCNRSSGKGRERSAGILNSITWMLSYPLASG
jgi:hypothetical protein